MGKEKYKSVYKSSSYMRAPGRKKATVRIKVDHSQFQVSLDETNSFYVALGGDSRW